MNVLNPKVQPHFSILSNMTSYSPFILTLAAKMMKSLQNTWTRGKRFLHEKWKKCKPQRDKLKRTFLAICAIASTFKVARQAIPIIMSIMTVLATLPLVSHLFPSFFFTINLSSTLVFSILGVISIFAGYSQYKELKLRHELDAQITDNQQKIKDLQDKNVNVR